MDGYLWIIVTLVALGVIIGLAVALMLVKGKRPREMTGAEYRSFFIIGVVYLAAGIILTFVFPGDMDIFNFFTFMGIIFTAMGLSNIDKWRKKPD